MSPPCDRPSRTEAAVGIEPVPFGGRALSCARRPSDGAVARNRMELSRRSAGGYGVALKVVACLADNILMRSATERVQKVDTLAAAVSSCLLEKGEEDTVGFETEVETTHVSRQEAARLAGVHVNTIRLWEENGRVHAQKLENGRVMIPMSELEAIVRERRSESGGDPEHRVVELEAENGFLRAEIGVLRETLERLQKQHGELLQTVIELAKGRET